MSSKSLNERLVWLPTQLIRTDSGAILKRGAIETSVSGPAAYESLKIVIEETSKEGGATAEAIRSRFARSSKQYVTRLLDELLKRRFLATGDTTSRLNAIDEEDALAIYYWHFDLTSKAARERLNRNRLMIVGVNGISRQLAHMLQLCGLQNVVVVDHAEHQDRSFFDEEGKLQGHQWPSYLPAPNACNGDLQLQEGDCLVATSDSGNSSTYPEWNRKSLERRIHFLPVILRDMIGYIGPMIVPGESPCYECLSARLRSNAIHGEIDQRVEKSGHEHGHVVGFHPAMSSVLGGIAAFQLTSFYAQIPSFQAIGKLIEVNLLSSAMVERRVLRVPRCGACSHLQRHGSTNIYKTVFAS